MFRYVVIPYVDGVTLREWVDENPDATAGARLAMLRTVAAALDEMHCPANTEVPAAHGDVKPANIVVRPDGGTVLVDLGLARLADAAGVSGRSNPYAAPELRGPGAQATPPADAFAFAATAAQILTSRSRCPPTRTASSTSPRCSGCSTRHPVTARRPMLSRQILSVVSAPPEARPRRLGHWLSAATDTLSQMTTPAGGPPPAPGVGGMPGPAEQTGVIAPTPRRRRGRTGLLVGAAALVVLLAGGGPRTRWPAAGRSTTPHRRPRRQPAAHRRARAPSPRPPYCPTPTAPLPTPTAPCPPPSVTHPPTPRRRTPAPAATGLHPPPTSQWVSDLTMVDSDQAAFIGDPVTVGAAKVNGKLYGHAIAVNPAAATGTGATTGPSTTCPALGRPWTESSA